MTPINNQHLNNLISAMRVAANSPQWQIDHWTDQPEKAGQFIEAFDRSAGFSGAGEPDRTAAVEQFTQFISDVLQADPQLKGASQADIDWFTGLSRDEPEIIPVLSTIWLWLHQVEELLTPQEVLNLLADDKMRGERGLRKRVAAGDFPGAVKQGNSWVIPKSTLVALGWLDSQYLWIQTRRADDVSPKPKRRRPGRPTVEKLPKITKPRGRPPRSKEES